MIVALLYATFHRASDTLCVFASVPFASIGGVLALAVRGMPLSISAAVGFITLSGVSVLSSMVLVAAFRRKLEQCESVEQAICEASLDCLRTILMTSLVASVGFLPMASSIGMGAEVQRPLATVVIGGVIASMLMTLFVLPVMLAVMSNRQRFLNRRRNAF
jgi:cobalt-zinc-cadmium resistance protein CzcA